MGNKTGKTGWIGVDLDGTLAQYDTWKGPGHVGDPVPAMAFRVRKWLADGERVKIFTARVNRIDGYDRDAAIAGIEAWCLKHFGQVLEITCCKDFHCIQIWDDRSIQIEFNTGRRIDGKP